MKSLNYLFKILLFTVIGAIVSSSSISQCVTSLTPESNILSPQDQALVGSWLPAGFEFEAEKVYDSAVSGSLNADFHAACDGLSNTLLVGVTEEGYIYGGYNEGTWASSGGAVSGLDNNFLFSVTLNEVYPAIPGETHITNNSSGLRFGGVNPDLFYFTNVGENVLTLNELGNSYECPTSASNCELHLNNNVGWNGQTDRFETASWEVWQLKTSGTPVGQIVDANFDGICDACVTTLTPNSNILDLDDQSLVSSWLPSGFDYEAELVYQSSVSGSLNSDFHAACDGLSNTLLVAVSAQGYVYGGYNEGTWSSSGGAVTGLDNNFLFSVTLDEVYPAIPGETHITNNSSGIQFGGGTADLFYFTNVGENVLTLNNLGNSYECPASSSNCELHLNGNIGWNGNTDRFETASWEVWQLKTSGDQLGESEDSDNDGICDELEIPGCQDPLAINYTPGATDPGYCEYAEMCVNSLTPNSSILSSEDQWLVSSWLPNGFEYEAEVVYQSSVSGSLNANFHAACDGLSNTLLVAVTAEGYVYGGYNEGTWSSSGGVVTGLDNNFLFSVTLNEVYPAIPGQPHITSSETGLRFGGSTPDLFYFTNVGENVLTMNNLGNSYECPTTASNCQLHMNGNIGWNDNTDRFETASWEVWQLKTSGTPIGQIIDSDDDGVCDGSEVSGCTNEDACNYNSLATDDDNSCVLPGCSDSEACNYDPEAACDGGECHYPDGCTDAEALNYCSHYLCDDGSCLYEGCTNPASSNYDSQANYDDGSCDETSGCTTFAACNYNSFATQDDGSCVFPVGCEECSGEQDGTGSVIDTDSDNDGVCDDDEVSGCTNSEACNYDPLATENDGSCTFTSNLANAGPDLFNCHSFGVNSIFSPQGTIPSGFTGLWTVESGNASITVTTQVSPIPQVLIQTGQVVVLRLTITNGECTDFDEMTCTNYSNVSNANAGPDQSQCNNDNFNLAANSSVFGSGMWTSDNPLADIDEPTDPFSDVDMPAGETATLTWTLTNGLCSDSDEMTITNYAEPTQAVCSEDFSFCVGTTFSLEGNAPSIGIGSWSTVSGPGSAIGGGISPLGSLSDGSSTTFRYTITNGDCSTFDEITVTNDASPGSANAGPNISFCGPEVNLNANSPSIGIGQWTSSVGNVVFDDINDPTTSVSGLNVGQTAELFWTLNNGTCTSNPNGVNITREEGGCTDNTALNYNASALCDDGSCMYSTPGFGCTDANACNYDASADTDDGSCTYNFGCIDEAAYNYNPTAECDDDSCVYPGCIDPQALNFLNNPLANFGDDSCIYAEGCTYPNAPNYDPSAVVDDGSCEVSADGSCLGDLTGDGFVSAADLTVFLSVFGSSCDQNEEGQ